MASSVPGLHGWSALPSVLSRPRSPATLPASAIRSLDDSTEAQASVHSAFQSFGRNILQNTEIGRMYGQEAAAQGLTGTAFNDFVAQGLANPSPGYSAGRRGDRSAWRAAGRPGYARQLFREHRRAGCGTGPTGMARGLIGNFLFPVFKVGMNHLTQTIEKGPIAWPAQRPTSHVVSRLRALPRRQLRATPLPGGGAAQ